MLKVGSLFSGAGLCDLGLSWAGFKHQWFCEVDAHCRAVLARHCRVDDGRTEGLDGSAGAVAGVPSGVGRISRETARAWMPRLKALGNGIVPQQAYAVAACILRAEELPMPPLPTI